jgi:surface carbohydrate biosynthesis protein
MKGLVYLPCELKSRDLEPRFLLAGEILKRGLSVIIGQQWALWGNAESAPRGAYVFSTANNIQAHNMTNARKNGHCVIGGDHEGLPFSGDGCLINVVPEAVASSDVFLTASDGQQSALSTRFPNGNFALVGSPRIDILRQTKPPRPIAEPYLLFNTNFALINSVWGSTTKAVQAVRNGGNVTKEEMKLRVALETDARTQVVALIRWCVKNLPWLTVIRPHPAEDPLYWAPYAGDRCRVVSGEAPIPWIANAELVLHSNSTTGLEAALLNRPCINVCPAKYKSFTDQFVMGEANVTVDSGQDAAQLIADNWRSLQKLGPQKVPYFPPNAAANSADAIVSALEKSPAWGEVNLEKIDWTAFPRGDGEKRKFTVSRDEAFEAAKAMFPLVGLSKPASLSQVEDSVFFLNP